MKKENRLVVNLVIGMVLGTLLGACGGSPTEPDPSPGPKDGPISATYQRPTGMTCRSAGTQFDFWCDNQKHPIMITSESWPSGYGFAGEKMDPSGDGFIFSSVAPITNPPNKLGIYVLDPWLCPAELGCNYDATGQGITINGVLLTDTGGDLGSGRAYFSFVAPATVIP